MEGSSGRKRVEGGDEGTEGKSLVGDDGGVL